MEFEDEVSRAVAWVLWSVEGVGHVTLQNVEERVDSLSEIAEMSGGERERLFARVEMRESAAASLVEDGRLASPVEAYHEELDRLPEDARIVGVGDPEYPERFDALDQPPPFLYVRGQAASLQYPKTVSIVGSRSARTGGVRFARELAARLARRGVVVVSGGAIGIDAAAHRGAIDVGVATVVALAGGIERPTPRKNARVFEDALDVGCLISEYPVGVRPRRYHFHRRNRLIAALGDGTVVVRAGEESGTMITARAARRIGRPLLAVPGPVDDDRFAGCLQLLVDGAHCVRGAEDIMQQLFGVLEPKRPAEQSSLPIDNRAERTDEMHEDRTPSDRPDLEGSAKEVYELLCRLVAKSGESHVDHDVVRRKWTDSAAELDKALLQLELDDVVAKTPGRNAYHLTM